MCFKKKVCKGTNLSLRQMSVKKMFLRMNQRFPCTDLHYDGKQIVIKTSHRFMHQTTYNI